MTATRTKAKTTSRTRTGGGGGRTAVTPTDVTGILTVAQAATALGIGTSTAYDAIRAKTFPVRTVTLAGRLKVLRADLDRFLSGGPTNGSDSLNGSAS